MKKRYSILLIILSWGCNHDQTCQYEYSVKPTLLPFKQSNTLVFNNVGNSYNIKCNSFKDTTCVFNRSADSEEDKCQHLVYTYHGYISYFSANIPIDPLNYISSIKLSLGTDGHGFDMDFNTSNEMSEHYYFSFDSKNKLYGGYYGGGEKYLKTVYFDTCTINTKTYHAVNKIYSTGKSFIDTIYYNYEVGFIKFVINTKEYIIQN
jgi:hypothetical protein